MVGHVSTLVEYKDPFEKVVIAFEQCKDRKGTVRKLFEERIAWIRINRKVYRVKQKVIK